MINSIDTNSIPEQVKIILFTLHRLKYKGYIVGDTVRDLLLGKQPCSWVICSNASINCIAKIIPKKNLNEKYGVILVSLNGMDIRITRLLRDGPYSNLRHPDTVEFVDDVMEDLNRRESCV